MIVEKEIIEFKTDFGVVVCNLKKLMDDKGISINVMSRRSKVRYEVVKKYYYNENYGFNGEILAKFCYILDCDISDLISYIPTKSLIN